MRQSTTRVPNTDWMDRSNASRRAIRPPGTPFQSVNPAEHLQRLRISLNEQNFDHKPTRGRRVCLYVRTLPKADPEPFFAPLRVEAARLGWQAGQEIHDSGGPQAPQQSAGWLRVRKLIHEGFADGVIAVNRFHISRDDGEYVAELRFVHERLGVTGLITPETGS
ncbi:hypothetical protein [Streptomyces sp. NPDC088915]|uniref:hypothetical protein n=1 Tax=Streptomyces sp. NPDC088915 TaxID=3365912 RepID=UPI003815652A